MDEFESEGTLRVIGTEEERGGGRAEGEGVAVIGVLRGEGFGSWEVVRCQWQASTSRDGSSTVTLSVSSHREETVGLTPN